MKRLLPLLERLETGFDAVHYRLRDRWDRRPLTIHPYRGFGNHEVVHIEGRILRNRPLSAPDVEDPAWRNVWAMARRFASDEVPGVTVQATLQGRTQEAVTDEEGYFHVTFDLEVPLPGATSWHNVALTLAEHPGTATEQVLVPPASARFGVVSDIDDTVLQTGAARLFMMARQTFSGNAHTRRAFEGVGRFYQALQQGADGQAENPVFYVSSSPWNLYDFLVRFLRLNDLPDGPLFLRDLGLNRRQVGGGGHHTHKLARIRTLLTLYPGLPFVLIGDSGQHDPEIYRQVVEDFPGRIRAVYIRDVSPDVRDAEVRRLADVIAEQDVDLVLAPHTTLFAHHAAEAGLIGADVPGTLPPHDDAGMR